MEIAKKITKHLCRLTLMWVMLLWAFTLPGQEVAVYDFLLTGPQTSTGVAVTTNNAGTVVKAQAVTAFVDAKPASGLVLAPKKLLEAPAVLFPAYFSVTRQEPTARLALKPISAPLLARLVPVTIQPNAP